MFSYNDIISSKLLQSSFYTLSQNKEGIYFEYLPTDFNEMMEQNMIYESEEFSLLLNLFGLDVTSEKLPFSEIRKLLFIEKEEDEINELDLDESDFDLTKDTKKFISSYLKFFNELTEVYPILYILFGDVWTILRYLVCKEDLYDGKYKIDFDSASTAYVNLYNDIYYILTHREQMKQELLDIFNISSEYKVKLPTSEIALIYQAYNQNRGYDLILNELNPYIKNAENQLMNLWEDIIKILPSKLNEELSFPTCDSLTKFVKQMVKVLIHKEQTLRKCKNCGRFFVARYSSLAEYCTRKVAGTKQACQEYASKKIYKKKQAENPLYQVFTTYYNRIYGRIRRGSLDKDTPLLDDIKFLHQEFSSKYDSAKDNDSREKIINLFTLEADKLLN